MTMSDFPTSSQSSLDNLGLVITNVRSLANMADEPNANSDDQRRQQRNSSARPVRQPLRMSHYQQWRQEQRPGSRTDDRHRRKSEDDDRRRRVPSRQDTARAAQSSTSYSSLGGRTSGLKLPTSGVRRRPSSRSAQPQPQAQPVDRRPSTSAIAVGSQPDILVVDRISGEAPAEIDQTPYNELGGHDDPADLMEEPGQNEGDAARSHSTASGRHGRFKRPVLTPFPLDHQDYMLDEYSYGGDPEWEAGGFFDDLPKRPAHSPSPQGAVGGREERTASRNRQRRESDGPDELDSFDVSDVLEDVNFDDPTLKPCLKKELMTELQDRPTMNVSWNDENNEFDTADYEFNYPDDDDEEGYEDYYSRAMAMDMLPSCSFPQQLKAKSDQSLASGELSSCPVKTPSNSTEETTVLHIDLDRKEEGDDHHDERSPPLEMDVHDVVNVDRDSPHRCVPAVDDAKHVKLQKSGSEETPKKPEGLVKQWGDEELSLLTLQEKRALVAEHQAGLAIHRYDDPFLSRADRIRLLWEDCARKERLLYRLRPQLQASSPSGAGGGGEEKGGSAYGIYRY